MHSEHNHLCRIREDGTEEPTPCVTVTVIVHVADGIDLHSAMPLVMDVAKECVDSMHADAHAGDDPPAHHTNDPRMN